MSQTPQEALIATLARILGRSDPLPRLEEALTHRSFANEAKDGRPHYERLEFLGDAVLQLTVSELLFERFPQASDAQLTRMRAALVNAGALATFARRVNLGPAMNLGKGAEAAGEAESTGVLCDAAEAVLGAVYLGYGLECSRAYVAEMVRESLGDAERLDALDPKSAFQELAQARKLGTPTYRVVEESADRRRPGVRVEVVLGGAPVATGEGESRRAAERAAAAEALRVIHTTEDDSTP